MIVERSLKRKECEHSDCPFCVRIAFDRSVGSYIVKLCRCLHIGHVVNLASIPGYVRFESSLSIEERGQLAIFGKIGYTGLTSKCAFCRLFSGQTYDSDMIYRVVKKARILYCGDATNCMLKVVELGNYCISKGGVLEITSDKGGILEILHWARSLSSMFVDTYNDFILIDGTHKTNVYNLSLIVTTTVDSLGISVPVGFLIAPSENSASIEDHLAHLRISGIHSNGLHRFSSRSIMTDEGSALVKFASLISGHNHYLCSFHVHQLVIRVSYYLFLCEYTLCCLYTYISLTLKNVIELSWSLSRIKIRIFEKCLLLFVQILGLVFVDAFNVKFTVFYNKFQHYPAAKKFIDEKLMLNKGKTDAFFTKHVFTAGHTSSQRSESLNSLFKGFGTMKREITTWNIFELMTSFDKFVERIYTQMFIEIRNVINNAISTER